MKNWGTLKSTDRQRLVLALRYGLAVLLVGIALTVSVIAELHNSQLKFVSPFELRLVQLLIFLVNVCLLIGLLNNLRHAQKLLSEAKTTLQLRGAERTSALEKANEDLKTSQAELQRRWQYLAAAQRLSHSGTFGWKVRSGELVWSDETYSILSFTETHPTLDLVFDRIHPEDRDRMQELRDRATQNGMDLDAEHRILMPEDVIKYVHVVAHAGRDSSGNLEYVGVVTDITERKRAEEERQVLSRNLQESKARLEEAQRIAQVGHYYWDLDSKRVIWSDELYRIYGLRPQEGPIDDAQVREMIHPDDRENVYRTAEEGMRSGVPYGVEHRVVRPNGEVRTVQGLSTVKRDASGRAYEIFGTVQDITERKRAEEDLQVVSRSLQESNARLKEAQRIAHVGHWEWELHTGSLTWSDETYRIYGLRPQERTLDIAMLREMIHPEDRESMFRKAEEALLSGARPEAEFRIVRPGGEVRIVYSQADAKRDASGQPYQMFGTTQDITGRKHAEEELQAMSRDLQESQAWLEEAQRVAHVGYWVWDLETNHLIWSDETYRIFGLTPREGLIDLDKLREMIHPDDREAVFRTAEEAIRSGTRADCEHRLLRPTGEMRVVHSLGDLKRDQSGRPYQMFGTSQDITDRKHAEEALQRNQFYLSEGQRLAHIGSWAFNESGHYWSDELYKIYGLDPQNGAPTVEQYLALIHPQDRAAMAETIRIMQEQHCGHDLIERIVRPDGQLRYVRAVAVPVVEKGVFKGFVGTTIDVTEHELLTQELRREQAYLAEAQSLAHIGSWATNFVTEQNFHISDETARLHGFDPHQGSIPLERFWATVHPEDEPAVRATLENAIRTGTDYDIREFRICRADDGQIRFLRTIGHHNPAGEIGYYVGITMDVTERKQAEQEREKLRQLEAELAHINRLNMMGELAAALAHEIKQPIAASITSANACLRWLAHDPPNLERARAAATRTKENGNRAADVIDSLRSFYKKGTSPERRMIDVKDIIQEMTVLLRNQAVRHSITIQSDLETNMPHVLVLADRVQLQQVFMNLMLNAIEAMKDTGGELTIGSRVNPEGQLVTSISDTGVGLPAENTDRIFEAFHTTKPQGTGMGLAITRSIVESYGGRVWATANQVAGATFHFTLPVEAEAQA